MRNAYICVQQPSHTRQPPTATHTVARNQTISSARKYTIILACNNFMCWGLQPAPTAQQLSYPLQKATSSKICMCACGVDHVYRHILFYYQQRPTVKQNFVQKAISLQAYRTTVNGAPAPQRRWWSLGYILPLFCGDQLRRAALQVSHKYKPGLLVVQIYNNTTRVYGCVVVRRLWTFGRLMVEGFSSSAFNAYV